LSRVCALNSEFRRVGLQSGLFIFKINIPYKTNMEKQIPRGKIETGITRCLSRVSGYLLDAERLIEPQTAGQGSLQNATILLTFAIEELGKAVILRMRSEEKPQTETVVVEHQVFGGRDAHEHKQSEAFKLIDASLKRLHNAAFSATAFGPDFDIEDVDISPATRLELSFIDFNDGDWSSPPPVEPKRLRALIIGATEVMKSEKALQEERFKKIGDKVTAEKL